MEEASSRRLPQRSTRFLLEQDHLSMGWTFPASSWERTYCALVLEFSVIIYYPPPPELSPLPVPLRMVITILITATMTATQDLHFHALSSRRLTFKATVEIVFSLLLLELKNKLLNQPLCILTLEFGSFLRKVTFRSK